MGVFTLTTNPVTAEFNGPTDPDSFSGARVARMILRSLGLASPLAAQQMLSHAQAYNDPGEASFWDIDPVAMQHTLADFDPRPPGGFPGHWRVYTNTIQTSANTQMRYTMDHYQVAPAALVYAGKHWLAVVGYSFDDNTGATTGFIIDDPAYTGGGANVGVDLSLWNTAFTPVGGGTKWLNSYVEVGDPDPAKDVPAEARPLFLRVDGGIIPPEEAVKFAIEGALRQFGDLPDLREALQHGRPGSPRLVARLDQQGSYYYLVPVESPEHDPESRESGQPVLAVIMVDARFGNVQAASASAEPFTPWPVSHRRASELLTRPIPVYESIEVAADRLIDAIGTTRDPTVVTGFTALRQTVSSALASFAAPRNHLVLRMHEFEISSVLAWHPSSGVPPFHPYFVARTPWDNIYVNIHSGQVRWKFPYPVFLPRLGA